MTEPNESCWGLIIKTDSYAGNFERELCAWLTGTIGECGVGKELVEPDIEAMFENLMYQVTDDHGYYRPVSIRFDDTNNLVIFFESSPSEQQMTVILERSKRIPVVKFMDGTFNIKSMELIEYIVTREEISREVFTLPINKET